MRNSYLTAVFATALSALSTPSWATRPLPSATIEAGVVVGTTTSISSAPTAVNQFLGVPFAAPPKRFLPAVNASPWNKPLDTKVYKPACVQQFSYPEDFRNLAIRLLNTPAPEESEDCLYLNIYAPSTPPKGKGRAVLFWIYGGGLWLGHAAHPFYDGSHFAAHEDVIVVAANYRTNVFGFPNSPDLPIQSRNLGFLDQRAALAWVQRNIHAFGGDASKVTIFGESAGAFSIDALLTSYPKDSTPPFRAAILESGQLSYRGHPAPGEHYPDGRPAWDALTEALNCTDETSALACVSAASALTIKDFIERQSLSFTPVYDNVTLVSNLAQARISGDIARIPLLSGTCADEGRLTTIGENNVTAYLNRILGPKANAAIVSDLAAAYPIGGADFPTANDAIGQMETDIVFHCGAALVANDTAEAGIPSWRFYYNGTFPNIEFFPDSRVYHTAEIRIVFSTYSRENATAQQAILSDYMRGTWARFAKDPKAGPGWNAIGTSQRDVAVIGGPDSAGVKIVPQDSLDQRCKAWRSVIVGDS